MSSPVHWASFLKQIFALEQSWNAHSVSYPRADAVPWLPLPTPQYIALLTDAVQAAPVYWGGDGQPQRTSFLDVGCGTGTKIMLGEALFGLAGFGIDIVPAFIAEARQNGVHADLVDAFDFTAYNAYDIVFANRPSTMQDELESLICEMMRRETVLAAANWRHDPAEFGFEPVAVEYGRPVHGVWRKPAA